MGQVKSCGATQFDGKPSTRRRAITRLPLVTGGKPVGTYLPIGVQPALSSPFGKGTSAAIPPSAALCENLVLRTRLRHRFVILNLRRVYSRWLGIVKEKISISQSTFVVPFYFWTDGFKLCRFY